MYTQRRRRSCHRRSNNGYRTCHQQRFSLEEHGSRIRQRRQHFAIAHFAVAVVGLIAQSPPYSKPIGGILCFRGSPRFIGNVAHASQLFVRCAVKVRLQLRLCCVCEAYSVLALAQDLRAW